MIIRLARPSDVDTIEAWRAERLAWLASCGSDQWSNPMPRRVLDAEARAGLTWMVCDGAVPMLTISVLSYEDFDPRWSPDSGDDPMWPDDPRAALYAARMVGPRRFAGLGLGGEALDWAAGRANDAGVPWLRLDAWNSNTALHGYYRRLGFHHMRTVTGPSGTCFQRPAAPYGGYLRHG